MIRNSTRRLQTDVASLDTTTNDRAHRGNKDDSSVRALAVKPRACGAPLRGFGA
jgi:hypothetical protein